MLKRQFVTKPHLIFSLLLTSIVFTFTSHAAVIPAEIDITGNVSFSVADSVPFSGTGSQSATMSQILAGAATATTIADVTPTGDNPLGVVSPDRFTDTGDGLGLVANVNGEAGDIAELFVFDFSFDLANTSATDEFKVYFELSFSNYAKADGSDTYAWSELNLYDSLLSELFFSDLISDTLFGDNANGVDLGSFGVELTDSGTFLFDFTLAAGASTSFSAVMKIEGGDFSRLGTFNADAMLNINILDVEKLTSTPPPPTNDVPAPSAAYLLLIALFGFVCSSRKSRVA
ncbi:MAG: hypothetical protein GW763_09330 [Paraglaciecola sp.]|nr:hypothetical protein [Paraglaciecola sp.]NCT48170.1 hypothetical protein [Paraglaciecola sp.]